MKRIISVGLLLLALGSACRHAAPAPSESDPHVRWLVEHSMLASGEALDRQHSAIGAMWQHPYAKEQPRAAAALASVWFTAYPAATLTEDGRSVLATLSADALWSAFETIGIRGIHTGPMKLAGGLDGESLTPTVDGNFDRIASAIDPKFGTEAEYRTLVRSAHGHHGIVIGDIIPGHSGKGADFRLAELGYGDYPGLYHLVRIDPADWKLLPEVPAGHDTVNLRPPQVDALAAHGYIVGQLPRTLFYEPGVKETDWSATPPIRGADGVERRWVYLHYFKEGQPTFNWLDPTFAVQRLVIGDAIHSLDVLGERMLRLDANGFLGIEKGPEGARAWSEGHPLSHLSNQLIAGMVRKLGGFTFQELNLTLEDLKTMSQGGADLSYDFVTRPAYEHALATGDAEFLRLMLALENRYRIDPGGLIHALQNHDELTLELVHFWFVHAKDTFVFRGRERTGTELRELIRSEMHEKLLAPDAPYNLKASNGVACTSATLAAAALGIRDLSHLTADDKGRIQKAHLLLAAFNALQPGIFALSGWDLVGALTLPPDSVRALLADGDTRWINRGAYDLLHADSKVQVSASGIPRAPALYGDLPTQLRDPTSFASSLKKMLGVRQTLRLEESEAREAPPVKARGLVVLVNRLPDGRFEMSAFNFGLSPIDETVEVHEVAVGAAVTDAMADTSEGSVQAGHRVRIRLSPHAFKVLLAQ